jgi:CRISPR-associated protein Cas1
MATLYLSEQGAKLCKESNRFIVEKDDKILLEVPDFKIDRILIFGNIQLTPQAISHLLEIGIDVSFFTFYGRLRGTLQPIKSKNIYLRMAQYERYYDEEFKLNLAKTIVEGKIKNSIIILERYQRNHPEIDFSEYIDKLNNSIFLLKNKNKVSSVRGIEGYSSSIYFEGFSRMIRRNFKFSERCRKPPKDPVNSLLSLGYTLITNEILSATAGFGFDPYIGYLHQIDYGRPSLALDIVEQFRAPVVDRFTLNLINKEIFDEDDFEIKEEGVYLKENSRKEYFLQYEKYITRNFKLNDEEVNFRKLFQIQTQKMINVIMEKQPYECFKVM